MQWLTGYSFLCRARRQWSVANPALRRVNHNRLFLSKGRPSGSDPFFCRLSTAAGSPEELVALQSDPTSIAPERAAVFEVASSLSNFQAAASGIAGLEVLAESETKAEPDEYFAAERPGKSIDMRLYIAMPDKRALERSFCHFGATGNAMRACRGAKNLGGTSLYVCER